jgi:hypothetical protein
VDRSKRTRQVLHTNRTKNIQKIAARTGDAAPGTAFGWAMRGRAGCRHWQRAQRCGLLLSHKGLQKVDLVIADHVLFQLHGTKIALVEARTEEGGQLTHVADGGAHTNDAHAAAAVAQEQEAAFEGSAAPPGRADHV